MENQRILDNLYFDSRDDSTDGMIVKQEVKEENEILNYEADHGELKTWNFENVELNSNPLNSDTHITDEPKLIQRLSKNKSYKEPLKKKYSKKKLDEPIICSECGRSFFYRAYFIFHFKDVHQNQNQGVCHHCGKSFKNQRGLKNHILTHQPDSEKQFQCENCFKKFGFFSDFLRHKRVS